MLNTELQILPDISDRPDIPERLPPPTPPKPSPAPPKEIQEASATMKTKITFLEEPRPQTQETQPKEISLDFTLALGDEARQNFFEYLQLRGEELEGQVVLESDLEDLKRTPLFITGFSLGQQNFQENHQTRIEEIIFKKSSSFSNDSKDYLLKEIKKSCHKAEGRVRFFIRQLLAPLKERSNLKASDSDEIPVEQIKRMRDFLNQDWEENYFDHLRDKFQAACQDKKSFINFVTLALKILIFQAGRQWGIARQAHIYLKSLGLLEQKPCSTKTRRENNRKMI